MPHAQSKAQQRAAGAALAAKTGGKAEARRLRGAAKEMEKSMSEAELRELASTPHADLPDRVED